MKNNFIKYWMRIAVFVALFFGAIQPNYAHVLEGVELEKSVKNWAESTDEIKSLMSEASSNTYPKTKAFFKDLKDANDVELFKFFLSNFNGVKAWKAMLPDEFLRKNTEWLEKVSNYFTLKPNRYDEFVDHFPTEKSKGRATAYLKSLTERKTHSGIVWRNQQKTVGSPVGKEYEEFFNNGMQPKGTHDNLLRHTESNTTAGNFISSTLDKNVAPGFGGKNGWVFEIKSTDGIDINKTLGNDALQPGQFEVSIPNGVLAKDIKGVWRKVDRQLTEWIPNPNYIP